MVQSSSSIVAVQSLHRSKGNQATARWLATRDGNRTIRRDAAPDNGSGRGLAALSGHLDQLSTVVAAQHHGGAAATELADKLVALRKIASGHDEALKSRTLVALRAELDAAGVSTTGGHAVGRARSEELPS